MFLMALNWKVPVSSLLSHLQKNDYKIFSINNGAETVLIDQNLSDKTARVKAVEEIVSVDSSVIALNKNRKTFAVYIVLGNDPEEIAADYSEDEDLEKVIDEFTDSWQDKKCPRI